MQFSCIVIFAETKSHVLIAVWDTSNKLWSHEHSKNEKELFQHVSKLIQFNPTEKGEIKVKIEALKKSIHMILAGERMPGLLMTVIRFVLPLQDHMIKKLLLVFWEIVPKTTPDGKLMQEMILVCDAYRKDLQHPNEFIRGSTLR